MEGNKEWRFGFASIEEAMAHLHYHPNQKNVRGSFLVDEPDLKCIIYTNRWSVKEYLGLLEGEKTRAIKKDDAAELVLYKHSNVFSDALKRSVSVEDSRLLISCFPTNGNCANEIMFIPYLRKPQGMKHLEFTEEDKQKIRDRVLELAANKRPCLVLVSRVETS